MSTAYEIVRHLLDAAPGPALENYIVPGLRSTLVQLSPKGDGTKTRVFEMTRPQEAWIVPHDHRYDFECLVVRGSVTNTKYGGWDEQKDPKEASHAAIFYDEARHQTYGTPVFYTVYQKVDTYSEGDSYGMTSEEFHSVHFSEDAVVLFYEGRTQAKFGRILLPVVGGQILDTYYWRDWMMTRAPSA